jgi:hypothetical protein
MARHSTIFCAAAAFAAVLLVSAVPTDAMAHKGGGRGGHGSGHGSGHMGSGGHIGGHVGGFGRPFAAGAWTGGAGTWGYAKCGYYPYPPCDYY